MDCRGCSHLQKLIHLRDEKYESLLASKKMEDEQKQKYMEECFEYNGAVTKRNEFLEKEMKEKLCVMCNRKVHDEEEGEDDDDDDENPLSSQRPLYAIPWMTPPQGTYDKRVYKILTPPVVRIPELADKNLKLELSVSIIKKYEKVLVYAANRYEKWAKTQVPPQAKEYDDGSEWFHLHMGAFKAANPLPPSSFLKIYTPVDVYRWHNIHARCKPNKEFLAALQRKSDVLQITSMEEVKEHFKKHTAAK